MSTIVKALTIQSRGRKYWTVLSGKYTAKLLINDATDELQVGQTVVIEVIDRTTRSKFGVDVIYEPVEVRHDLSQQDLAAERKAAAERKEAEKWLGYAEDDVREGMSSTKAIAKLDLMDRIYPDLAPRIQAVRDAATRNGIAIDAKRAAQRQEWAAERAADDAARATRRAQRMLYPVGSEPATGVPLRLHGEVVVIESYGKSFRIGEDDPSVFGSHLLGHEGEYGHYGYYRLATADEIAALEAKEQAAKTAQAAAQARRTRIAAIKTAIQQGDRPDGMHRPEGDRVLDTQTVYGGGDWFVVGTDAIWYVQNNGADGDNWSHNNIRTGGAGAIGWRIDYDETLAAELRDLEAMAHG